MATAATGTVEAMKRLFENNEKSGSGSFINNHDNLHNGMPRGSNGHSTSSKNATNQNSYASSVLSQSAASERSCTDRSLKDQSRNKPAPPKVKPKPHVVRKTAPAIHSESSERYKNSKDRDITESSSVAGSYILGVRASNGTKENNVSSKHPVVAENDIGNKVNKARNENAAPLPVPNSSQNSSRKPPPVPKKPKSILSGYSNDVVRTQYKYDEALEKQFGLKMDQTDYDFTERWVAYQADRQQGKFLNKFQKGANEASGKTTLNGSPINVSQSSSVCSSTGMSGSNFTNSSIRSILKKNRPSLGVKSKKRLTFKDDDELITKYNYPSEDSYADLDSLDRYRSAFDSDSDSDPSSACDEPEDYDLVNISTPNNSRSSGGRMDENRIVFTGSPASTTSSSTLKDSALHQQKHSSHRSRNHNGGRNNDDAGASNSKRTTEKTKSNKWPTRFIMKPSKSSTFERFSDGIQFHY